MTTLYRASPSRLLAYLDCPKSYRLTYLTTPRLPARRNRAHIWMGLAIHEALAKIWDEPVEERTPVRAATLVRRAWTPAGFTDLDHSDLWREKAASWVAQYVAGGMGGADLSEHPRGVERSVAMVTGPLALNGRVDRLDERVHPDGRRELVIVDYKTGRTPMDSEGAAVSLPLALYAGAAWKMFGVRCVSVELHHLPTGEIAAHEHTDESLTRLVGQARSIAQDAQRADAQHAEALAAAPSQEAREEALEQIFPAQPSALCRWCQWREHCPQGQAMGEEMPDWAGLD